MSTTTATATTLTVDVFWAWLKRHSNCILQASGSDAHLYDADDLHWHLGEEAERTLVIQLIRGKILLAELLVSAGQVLFVQSEPDPQDERGEHYIFELFGGEKSDPRALWTLVLAHGYDEQQKHAATMKH